jgi:hypothetical protein
MKPRISLLGLIGLTTLAGLACAALVKPSGEWTSVVVSLTALAIVAQTLRAILYDGERRAAAVGWLLFVSAYLAVALGPWLGTQVGPHLLTSRGIAQARQKWPEALERPAVVTHLWHDENNGVDSGDFWPHGYGPGGVVVTLGSQQPVWTNYFHLSAHWLFAWLAGWLGAIVATHFHYRGASPAA